MKNRVFRRFLSYMILLCMLTTQFICLTPSRADAAVDTSITYTDLFSNQSTSSVYVGRDYNQTRIPGIVVSKDPVTGNDVVLAYVEARGGTGGDWEPSRDILRRGIVDANGGITWDAIPAVLADGITPADPSMVGTMNNPLMIAEKNSSVVHFFHGNKYDKVYYKKSTDAGLTWSAEVEITSVFNEFKDSVKYPDDFFDWKVLATGPGHGIQLNNGTLVVPVWLANGTTEAPHDNSAVTTIYSDDGGTTWKRGSIVIKNGDQIEGGEFLSNPNETTIVELSDGRIMANMRNNSMQFRRAISVTATGDTISGWDPVSLDDELIDPKCFASTVRYDESRILFVSPNSQTARENLTLRMSEDDGQTWPYLRQIQVGSSGYSDIAVGSDKTIYVFYEQDSNKYTKLAKFKLDWLTAPRSVLQNIAIPGADMAPNFNSEWFSYDVRVNPETTSLDVSTIPFNGSSAPTIKVNGNDVTGGVPFTVNLTGETTDIIVDVSTGTESHSYTFNVKKKRFVTNWKFEEELPGALRDSSGYGNEAATTLRGVEYVPGYVGKALKFDGSPNGTNDYELADIPMVDETKFGTGDFAISSWINLDTIGSATQTIFWYGTSKGNVDTTQWIIWAKPKTATTASLELGTGDKLNGAGTEVWAWTPDAPIVKGQWHHILLQRKNGVLEIYVDGVTKVRKGSTPLNVSRTDTNLFIGRSKLLDRPMFGRLDEVRMYNYGLSESEVQALAAHQPIDTTTLEATISSIEALNSYDYTSESWTNLQNTLRSVYNKLNSDTLTAADVSTLKTNLDTAVNNLVAGIPVILSASPTEAGIVSGSKGCAEGESVTVTASPNAFYRFVNWTKNGEVVSTDAAYTFTMGTQSIDLVANFEPTVTHTVNVTIDPAEGGIVTGGGVYVQGAKVSLAAGPAEGYNFLYWSKDGARVSMNSDYTFTLGGDNANLVAKFVKHDLVTDWKFESTDVNGIHDSSGYGNSAAAISNVPFGPGYIGKALVFDGSSDESVNVTGIDETKFGTGDFTVTSWVNTDVVDGSDHILFWYGDPNTPLSQWWARISGNSGGKARIQFNTGNKFSMPSGESTSTTSYMIEPGKWYHVALQRIGGTMKVFVNGVQAVSNSTNVYNVSEGTSTDLMVGAAKTGAARRWIGKIDEVRMYNYGLSAEEIALLAAAPSIDTTALDASIEQARALAASNYTVGSWQSMQSQLTAAQTLLNSDEITQAGVDSAQAALAATIAALIPAPPSSGSTPLPSTGAVINNGDSKVNVNVTIDIANNNATVSLDQNKLNTAFGNSASVIVEVPKIEGVEGYKLEIPARNDTDSGKDQTIVLSTALGSISIPDNMLTGTNLQNAVSMTVSIKEGDKEKLPPDIKNSIGARPLISLSLSTDGKQQAWNNPDAPVTVSIPYTPSADELADTEHIVVWYIDGNGKVISVPTGHYDAETGTVIFTTTHFSLYSIAYVKKTFGDLGSTEWARKSIEALASKGIINGTGSNNYLPTANITRGDFLALLINTLGINAEVTDNFTDVSRNAHYYDEVGIAKKLGITAGTGHNRFNPDSHITRQEMMVLTERALRTLKIIKTSENINVLQRFTDRGHLDNFAVQSIANLVKLGIINGSGNMIRPSDVSTRASAAVILYGIYNLQFDN